MRVKVTWNVAQYILHHVTYSASLLKLLGVEILWTIAQYPLHHVTYAPAQFEVATSKGWGNAFSRKCCIWYLTLTLGSRSHQTLPSTLYIMWPMQLQSLKLLHSTIYGSIAVTRKYNILPFDLGVKVTWNAAQCPLHYVTFAASKFEVATSNSLGVDVF